MTPAGAAATADAEPIRRPSRPRRHPYRLDWTGLLRTTLRSSARPPARPAQGHARNPSQIGRPIGAGCRPSSLCGAYHGGKRRERVLTTLIEECDAYGKAPEEMPHVRIEVRLEANRGLQGQLQRDACPGRPHTARRAWPRGGRWRSAQGVLGVQGVRVRAHVRDVGGDTAPVGRRAPRRRCDVACGDSNRHVRARDRGLVPSR